VAQADIFQEKRFETGCARSAFAGRRGGGERREVAELYDFEWRSLPFQLMPVNFGFSS